MAYSRTWEDLYLQLSVSKNSVLMSIKNFPKSERFWQYNWMFLSYIVQHQNDGEYLILRTVDFPNRMGTPLVNLLSWRVSATALLLRVAAVISQFNLKKV